MIERETFAWGVSLATRPLAGAKVGGHLEIRADVMLPKPPRNSEIRLSFSGVPYNTPLKLTDAQIWSEALKAVLAEALSVAAELKVAKPKKRK
jgi:hypothetical protein